MCDTCVLSYEYGVALLAVVNTGGLAYVFIMYESAIAFWFRGYVVASLATNLVIACYFWASLSFSTMCAVV